MRAWRRCKVGPWRIQISRRLQRIDPRYVGLRRYANLEFYIRAFKSSQQGVRPRDPISVDLYEDRTLVFEKTDEEIVGAPVNLESVSSVVVDYVLPRGASLKLAEFGHR